MGVREVQSEGIVRAEPAYFGVLIPGQVGRIAGPHFQDPPRERQPSGEPSLSWTLNVGAFVGGTTLTAISSRSSLASASPADSPSSMWPPGKSHIPGYHFDVGTRRHIRTHRGPKSTPTAMRWVIASVDHGGIQHTNYPVGSGTNPRTSRAQRQAAAILAARSNASSREGTSTTASPARLGGEPMLARDV